MAQFITHIEFFDTADDSELYLALDDAMEKKGFKKYFESDSGAVYNLLTGEYYASGNYQSDKVLEVAKSAASRIGKKFSVFISQIQSVTWWNLKKAPSNKNKRSKTTAGV